MARKAWRLVERAWRWGKQRTVFCVRKKKRKKENRRGNERGREREKEEGDGGRKKTIERMTKVEEGERGWDEKGVESTLRGLKGGTRCAPVLFHRTTLRRGAT